MSKPVHCAIYTRKSSEEGLEQTFNSLEAQREASVAYIESQKHEGWVAIQDKYDDGGFSGGNMERPALIRLLDDMRSGKVQIVVVYKVDRLTRSLSDFAKIIEVFDSNGVSFVSVTQQFNTTTSMGRLTLNVLLSFAQFERELTGERIRDKVAASKKKGMWMGGVVPLGYDCINRCLIVNESEAKTVRNVFRQYRRLGSVSRLRDYLERHQIHSKVRIGKSGRTTGGVSYSRGALYQLLKNRVYVGKIVHREQVYPGQHQPIIDQTLWDQVATQLKTNTQAQRGRRPPSKSSLLTGLIKDTHGVRFTPTHSIKKGKRYRYYTSQAAIRNQADRPQITRYPARELETLVVAQIHMLLGSLDKYLTESNETLDKELALERSRNLAAQWPKMPTSKQHELVRDLLKGVVVGQNHLWIEVDEIRLLGTVLGQRQSGPWDSEKASTIKLAVDFRALRRGDELQIHVPDHAVMTGTPDPVLLKTVARARRWYNQLVSGEIASVRELSEKTGLKCRYVRQILQCATLSPKITEAILAGRQAREITGRNLLRNMPLDWRKQEGLFL